MTKAKETLLFLANFNSWRRGNGDSSEQPDHFEVGVAIDVAVNLLRRYDELERENIALRAALDSLRIKIADAAKGDCRKLHEFERIALAMKEAKP